MIKAIKEIELDKDSQSLVLELYERYSQKLQAYARKNYHLSEDVALNLVYKTIYRIAEVNDRYKFENEEHRYAFVFKTYLNYLRNHYRDDKTFENLNSEVELQDFETPKENSFADSNPKLKMLKSILEEMEDWGEDSAINAWARYTLQ